MRARVRIFGALAAVAAVALSGCTTIVMGTAERDPNNKDTVITALLQPGNYPTKPQAALGTAGESGNLTEARRMADALVMPFEVDPALTKFGSMQSGVIKNAAAVIKAFPKPLEEGADHNLISGVTVIGDNKGTQAKSLQNVVLRYATPEDAVAALNDMAGRATNVTFTFGDPTPTTPTTLPRYPDTKAFTWESAGGGSTGSVLALTAHGPYLLGQVTLATDGLPAAAELASATLDKQIPAIDSFKATPVDKLGELPLDRDNLMARTLPPPADNQYVYQGFYGPHGFLMFSDDPVGDQKLLAEAGVTTVAISGLVTYQAKDDAGAVKIRDAFVKAKEGQGYVEAPGVPGLPDAKCLVSQADSNSTSDDSKTYCVVSAGSVAFDVSGTQETKVHQQVAAQYLMLTAQ